MRIDVEDPRLAKQRSRAVVEMALQPSHAFPFSILPGATHRVLAQDTAHPEQLGHDIVRPQRRDVRVTLVPCQHRQQHRARARRVCLARLVVQVLRLICKGRTNKQIAEELYLSVRTVERHRTSIMRKAGLENRQNW